MSSLPVSFPYPDTAERRSLFLQRWVQHPKVKRVYGANTTAATVAGIKAWNKAKLDSEVSVTTTEDEFLVFGGPIY